MMRLAINVCALDLQANCSSIVLANPDVGKTPALSTTAEIKWMRREFFMASTGKTFGLIPELRNAYKLPHTLMK
ncbi:hypothetical protein BVIET440_80239 [Burkholderia vietnamiensis]